MQTFRSFAAAVDRVTGFAHWGPDSNPLIRQIQREDRAARLTLRRTLWGAWWLGLLGLVWATGDVLTTTRNGIDSWTTVINLFGWTALGMAPLTATATAARTTSRRLRAEYFDLVYITPLDNRALVRARVFDALFQQRRGLMLLVALMPYLIVYAFLFFLRLDRHLSELVYWQPSDVPAPNYWSVVGPTLWVLAITLGQWGNVLLGAAFGVRMGIFRRSALSSISVALVGMCLVLLAPCACFWTLTLAADGFFELRVAVFAFTYILPVGYLVIPWLLAWTVMEHTASVWPRE